MRYKALISVFIFMVAMSCTANGQEAIDPDSLRVIQMEFKEMVQEAKNLSRQIQTPEDAKDLAFQISNTEGQMKSLESAYSNLIYKDKKILGFREQFSNYFETIAKNLQEYQHEKTRDSIEEVLALWPRRLDSLLQAGQSFVSDKEGDSVRHVKEKARTWWPEISRLKDYSPDFFKEDENLKTQYTELEKTYTAITELPEPEKMKLRDILLVAGVIVGVLTMVIGMVSSRIRERKLQKKAEEMPPIEL